MHSRKYWTKFRVIATLMLWNGASDTYARYNSYMIDKEQSYDRKVSWDLSLNVTC